MASSRILMVAGADSPDDASGSPTFLHARGAPHAIRESMAVGCCWRFRLVAGGALAFGMVAAGVCLVIGRLAPAEESSSVDHVQQAYAAPTPHHGEGIAVLPQAGFEDVVASLIKVRGNIKKLKEDVHAMKTGFFECGEIICLGAEKCCGGALCCGAEAVCCGGLCCTQGSVCCQNGLGSAMCGGSASECHNGLLVPPSLGVGIGSALLATPASAPIPYEGALYERMEARDVASSPFLLPRLVDAPPGNEHGVLPRHG